MNKKKLNLNINIIFLNLEENHVKVISGKEIPLKKLNYWNVELQNYFSPIEVKESSKILLYIYVCPNPLF